MFTLTLNKTIKYYFFITKFAYNNNKNVFIELLFFEVITNYLSRITFEIFFNFRVKLIFVKTHAKYLNNFIKIIQRNFVNNLIILKDFR